MKYETTKTDAIKIDVDREDNQSIELEIQCNEFLRITINNIEPEKPVADGVHTVYGLPIEMARMMRDFLNYAVND